MPIKNEEGFLEFSSEGFQDMNKYKAKAGRAKQRADYYCNYVLEHFDTENPDLSSGGYLEIFVTWAAFSCEMYFKSVLFHINAEDYFNEQPDGGKRIKEHRLWELYNELTTSDTKQGTDYSIHISDGFADFDSQLKSVSSYFVKYRYDFEMDTETMNYGFVFELMKRLRSITNGIRFLGSVEVYQDNEGYLVLS